MAGRDPCCEGHLGGLTSSWRRMGEGDEGERGREGRREGEKRGQKWESMKWIGKRRKATVCR